MRGLLAIVGVLAALLLGACGNQAPHVEYQTAAVCVDANGYRVDDTYCPIGDGITNPGPAGMRYGWDYYEYDPYAVHDVVVPYVGYRAVGSGWSTTRPVNVTTINIHRGDYPTSAPANQPANQRGTSADVPLQPNGQVQSSSVTRGGLGVGATKTVSQPGSTYSAPKQSPARRLISYVKSKVKGS